MIRTVKIVVGVIGALILGVVIGFIGEAAGEKYSEEIIEWIQK